MTLLQSYLRDHRIKQAVFAEEVGLSQAAVSRLSSGTMKPSLVIAVRIQAATEGAVPVESWVDAHPTTEENAA